MLFLTNPFLISSGWERGEGAERGRWGFTRCSGVSGGSTEELETPTLSPARQLATRLRGTLTLERNSAAVKKVKGAGPGARGSPISPGPD